MIWFSLSNLNFFFFHIFKLYVREYASQMMKFLLSMMGGERILSVRSTSCSTNLLKWWMSYSRERDSIALTKSWLSYFFLFLDLYLFISFLFDYFLIKYSQKSNRASSSPNTFNCLLFSTCCIKVEILLNDCHPYPMLSITAKRLFKVLSESYHESDPKTYTWKVNIKSMKR